jgi:hypothetical protein
MLKQIGRYEKQIAEEEKLAAQAPTPDAALAHSQAAMLYRVELSVMRRRRAANVSELLSSIG